MRAERRGRGKPRPYGAWPYSLDPRAKYRTSREALASDLPLCAPPYVDSSWRLEMCRHRAIGGVDRRSATRPIVLDEVNAGFLESTDSIERGGEPRASLAEF